MADAAPQPTSRSRWGVIAAATLVALFALVAMGPVLANEFVSWDDYSTIARNPLLLQSPATAFVHHWKYEHMALWVPVTYSVWSGLAAVSHAFADEAATPTLSPAVYHGFNWLLHAASSVLCLLVVRRLLGGRRGATVAAMLGALVFATHPVQVESVAWASGTKDLLFGFFGLAAVLAYLRSIDAGRVCRGWFAAATLLFALGLLSKPTSVVVPAVAGVCAWLTCTDRATLRRALAPLLIWIALAIPAVVVAKLVQPADHGEARTSLVQRPLVAIDALAFYARQLAWPAGLAPDYARPPSKVLALPAAEKLWWLLPVALAAAGLWDLRRNRWPAGAGLVFVLGVAPVLGLVPFDFQKYSTVADHYLYLSMLGVAMLVAWAAVAWPRPAVPVAVLVAFALAGLSFLQAQVWRDTGTLFEHTLAHRPDSLAAPVSLSAWSMERNRPDDAMRWAQLAVERHPRDAQGHVALAVALAAHSRLDDAVAAYRRAIELSPTEAPAYANLAGLLAQTGKVADALPLAQRAIELDPSNPAARVNLGTMLLQSDRPHEALPHLELAVQLAPGDVTAHTNYGFALLVTGRPDLAAGQFRRALEINPAHRPAVEGYRAATGRQ